MQNAAICTWPAYARHRYIIPTGARSGYTAKRLHVVTKTLLVMKLTCLLLTAAFLNVSATGISQYVSFSGENIALEHVFTIVEKQTGYVFFYNAETLKETKPVTINAENMPLKDFLKKIMAGQPVKYVIRSKSISVSKRMEFIAADLSPQLNVESPPVSGVVHGADGQPLGGVNIVIKGTKKGTTSSVDGKFSIEAKEGDVLIFTSIGYGQKEIRVGAYIVIGIVQLSVSESKLDEIQIIAYGKTTQRLSTGNITTIKADVIEKQPVNNPLLALSGRVPGLFIEQATGFAGTGVKVRIQGQNSLNNGNDPLYVIDGVPYSSQLLPSITGSNVLGQSGGSQSGGMVMGNPFSFINSADIESIDVLKDADATSIYGSRAANGAILITTKKGKSGDLKINFNLQSGIGQVPKKLDLLNSRQYVEMRNEALRNDGTSAPQNYAYDINGTWDINSNTDWQKELLGGNASYNDAQVSVSGGSDFTQFLASGTYHKETSVFPGNSNDKRATMHFSLNSSSVNRKFKLQFSGSYSTDNNLLPGANDLTDAALKLPPNAPSLYDKNGFINWAPDADGVSTFQYNPIAYIYNTYNNKTNNLVSNLQLGYTIIDGLELKSSFSYNQLTSDEKYLIPSTSTKPEDIAAGYNPRSAYYGTNKTNTWVIEPQVIYNKIIGPGKLGALIGTTFQQITRESKQLFGYGYLSDQLIDNIQAAQGVGVSSALNANYKYNALFGRATYNVSDKYILNLNLRRDGSSRFGSKNQFHNFSSVGLAWIFSNENLIKTLSFLSYGKISASYGTTGNDQIEDYRFLSLYNPVIADNSYQGTTGLTPAALTNPYLQWEETRKIQATLDLGFLKDHILIKSTYFHNRSSNQLIGYKLPVFAGFTEVSTNYAATVQNSGWEISLSSVNLNKGNFKWSSSFNITIPKNKLIDFPNLLSSNSASNLVIGEPITLIRQFHFLGIDPATGIYMFADRNGNPVINPRNPSGADNNDKYIIGYPDPKFFGGFQNTLKYKNLELDLIFQFVKQKGRDYSLGILPGGLFFNQPVSVLNRWRKPGDIATIQRFNDNYSIFSSGSTASLQSDATWSDASYIRLKNLSLSWLLPASWTSRAHMKSCRLFIQGQNLLTITNYKGLDPETKSSSTLPPLRVITAGIKIGI